MRIAFCIGQLTKGGAERVVCNLANSFSKKDDISIISLRNDKLAYKLDKSIKTIFLDEKKERKIKKNYLRYKKLKELLVEEKYDIIICFLPEPSFLVLLLKKFISSKVIVSVRNDPRIEYKNLLYKILMKNLYIKADGFVFQTPDAQHFFSNKIQKKSVVILNSINPDFFINKNNVTREKLIVSVGRYNLFLCLVLSLLVCILLGMGLPTTAAYVLGAAVLVPALTTLGLDTFVAHMFVFFFSCLATITPPVCAAVFLASGIAESNWFQTGICAVLAALPAFIVPYTFAYTPALLMIGETGEILSAFIAAIIGVAILIVFGNDHLVPYVEHKLSYLDANGYTVSFLINNPTHIVNLFVNTLIHMTPYYVASCIGRSLGWLEITVNKVYIIVYLVLLIAVFFIKKEKNIVGSASVLTIVLCTISVLFIFVGMAVSWTPIGVYIVQGVQGRYFLPMLLPLCLSFKGWIHKNYSQYILIMTMYLSVLTTFDMMAWFFR